MESLRKINQDNQKKIVLEYLGIYNSALKSADSTLRNGLYSGIISKQNRIEQISALEDKIDKNDSEVRRTIKPFLLEKESLEAELQQEQKEYKKIQRQRNVDTIEIVINQYCDQSGKEITDVILPVKSTDNDNSGLCGKLYTHCLDVLVDYDQNFSEFNDYSVISLVSDEGYISRTELAKTLLQDAPEEFGGSKTSKPLIYLQVAPNFCFKYDDNQRVKKSRPKKVKVETELTTQKAYDFFDEGKTTKDLREMFPEVNKWTIAGYKAHHSQKMKGK
jgi:hypothetical protein